MVRVPLRPVLPGRGHRADEGGDGDRRPGPEARPGPVHLAPRGEEDLLCEEEGLHDLAAALAVAGGLNRNRAGEGRPALGRHVWGQPHEWAVLGPPLVHDTPEQRRALGVMQ